MPAGFIYCPMGWYVLGRIILFCGARPTSVRRWYCVVLCVHAHERSDQRQLAYVRGCCG
jgi:hypothetical protein